MKSLLKQGVCTCTCACARAPAHAHTHTQLISIFPLGPAMCVQASRNEFRRLSFIARVLSQTEWPSVFLLWNYLFLVLLPHTFIWSLLNMFCSFETFECINFWCLKWFNLSEDEGLNFFFPLLAIRRIIRKAWAALDPYFI